MSPSDHRSYDSLGLISVAVAVSAIAWSGHILLLPVACLFPVLWAIAPTRLIACLVSMGYFLAASRALPQGASTYLDIGLIAGIGLWIAASLSFVLVHTVLWTRKPGWRLAARYGLASILMAVPPFGITGWAGPITAAGVLFPGWGWFGLAATAVGLLVMTTRSWPIAAFAFVGAWILSAATWTPPVAPGGWIGINTSFDYSDKSKANNLEQHLVTIAMVKQAAVEGYSVIVLPESAFGIWTPTTQRLWESSLSGLDVSVLGGAIVVHGSGYDNVIVSVTSEGSEIAYRQRMPVPVAMWRPWASGGARAEFFRTSVLEARAWRIEMLICYEQLLAWPLIQLGTSHPLAVVAISNAWWAADLNVVANQRAILDAWASMFAVALVVASNP